MKITEKKYVFYTYKEKKVNGEEIFSNFSEEILEKAYNIVTEYCPQQTIIKTGNDGHMKQFDEYCKRLLIVSEELFKEI